MAILKLLIFTLLLLNSGVKSQSNDLRTWQNSYNDCVEENAKLKEFLDREKVAKSES